MIITQEEKSPIEDFVIRHNMPKIFDTVVEMSGATSVDTDELKVFVQETGKLLSEFVKHIDKVEKESKKHAAKQHFNDLVKKGASFDD